MSPEERLKQEILKRYKSVRAFTQEIGVSYSTVDSMLKRGVTGAGVGTVLKVCGALGIEVESLISDKSIFPSFKLTPKEICYIKKYRLLNEAGKQKTEEYIDLLLGNEDFRKSEKVLEVVARSGDHLQVPDNGALDDMVVSYPDDL